MKNGIMLFSGIRNNKVKIASLQHQPIWLNRLFNNLNFGSDGAKPNRLHPIGFPCNVIKKELPRKHTSYPVTL